MTGRNLCDASPQAGGSTPAQPAGPPRYKLWLATWLAAYPLLMTIDLCFGRWLGLLPYVLHTLASTGLLVAAIVWIGSPVTTRLLAGWLATTARAATLRSTPLRQETS